MNYYNDDFSPRNSPVIELQTSYVSVELLVESQNENLRANSLPVTINSEGDFSMKDILDFFAMNVNISQNDILSYWDQSQNGYVDVHSSFSNNLWIPGNVCYKTEDDFIIFLKLSRNIPSIQYQEELKKEDGKIQEEPVPVIEEYPTQSQNHHTSEDVNLTPTLESVIDKKFLYKNGEDPLINEQEYKKKKHRERTISEACAVVNQWRTLHEGVILPNTKMTVKFTLKDAAPMVGVPKKSLDDYLLVINQGKKLGFDFEKYKNEGFGFLRAFVKKNKPKIKCKKATREESENEDIDFE